MRVEPTASGTHMKTKTAILSIENLTEDGISELSATLQELSGVDQLDFSLERQVAVIEFDPEATTVENLIRSVLLKGYKVV